MQPSLPDFETLGHLPCNFSIRTCNTFSFSLIPASCDFGVAFGENADSTAAIDAAEPERMTKT
jgi:hypothetical protein